MWISFHFSYMKFIEHLNFSADFITNHAQVKNITMKRTLWLN
jgi:hypothetical protein